MEGSETTKARKTLGVFCVIGNPSLEAHVAFRSSAMNGLAVQRFSGKQPVFRDTFAANRAADD